MKIASFDIYQYSLELNQPLIVRGSQFKKREGLIIRLTSDDGEEGFGEIAPLSLFSRETLSNAHEEVLFLRRKLSGQIVPEGLERLDGQFNLWLNEFSLKPSVRFGVESAVLNLLAHAENVSLHKLISKTIHPQVRISGLLDGTQEEIVLQAVKLVESGFTELKLKVGDDIDNAIEKVQAVNAAIYGRALLHLDANQAWDFKEAVTFGKKIGCAAVSYIEEPFKDIQKIPEFFEKTMIPVALDESLVDLTFDDMHTISGVETLILKPTMLGGIEKTWEIVNKAESFALDTVISSSFESSLGIGTLASLAGSTPRSAIAGLDTLKWFKTDVLKQPISIENGMINITDQRIQTKDINFDCLSEPR